MKRLLTTGMGLLLLSTAIFGTGCAPMPYQGSYDYPPEVIIVYEPVPYPDSGLECRNPPPPPPVRHTPLKKESISGDPRTKTPRTDRGDDRVTKPRTREKRQSLAQQAGHQTGGRTPNKSR